MKDEEWYKNQIKGLLLILEDNKDNFIARDYVKEKLNMILQNGINFHPVIKKALGMKTYTILDEE